MFGVRQAVGSFLKRVQSDVQAPFVHNICIDIDDTGSFDNLFYLKILPKENLRDTRSVPVRLKVVCENAARFIQVQLYLAHIVSAAVCGQTSIIYDLKKANTQMIHLIVFLFF